MGIYFIDHADEMFIERGIPVKKIKRMLKNGAIIDDVCEKPKRKICIYKDGSNYYSVVFQPCGKHKFIITGYPSKEWEKRMYKGIKK